MTTDRDFPDGAALIVGGSGGIGRAIARQFALSGSDVAVTFHSREKEGKQAVEEVEARRQRAIAYKVDVTDLASVQEAIHAAARDFGRVHTVVFSAGRTPTQLHISQIQPEQWRAAIDVETLGLINVVCASLPHLRSQGGGSYVHLSSAGQTAWANTDGLSIVPKAANDSLIRGIAKEEGRFGIRANSVQVGIVAAGMFLQFEQAGVFDEQWKRNALKNLAIKRWGTPEEVGDAVVFLASRKAAYVTGQSICVAGGYGL